MKNEKIALNGICFGEILWDNLPTGRQLGGAPLNVAYHLNRLGIHTDLVTRIGDDQDGDDLVALSQELEVPIRLFQRDAVYPTSTVEVHFNENRDVQYEIVYPVAWDFISAGERERKAVRHADFFVFGSLSTRNEESYNALRTLLAEANYRVLDVNLRAPFYDKERIFELLRYANLVKMNEEELTHIATWLGLPDHQTDQGKVEQIIEFFDLDEVIVTYGAAGAIYYHRIEKFSYHFPAFKVEVRDTIGSGDSFLAAFLSQRCSKDRKVSTEEMLDFAATLSAFVTQSAGACPTYDASTIHRFQWKNFLNGEEVNSR
ncbi:carbohydrate kinase [Sphingobacterium alkalisoli]|uniref:Carbohydrate kinase n=1 Tax=Sphingobacterium alkalisoli TaxID=1874115 RepID=A0A4U0H1P5_9SPHI|nr:carbohydrate kinase [Sphingobacterium alkalisoli]TJY65517.1 carbohydrate kinase [Sphingobacterium alkalisoli]GGH19990.1 2-dehydro-3-deoxygluconokinase [Sphingobacterium alkalisoli]